MESKKGKKTAQLDAALEILVGHMAENEPVLRRLPLAEVYTVLSQR